MANQNYEPNEMGGRLMVRLFRKEKFYVIASLDTQPGQYTQIEEIGTNERGSGHIVSGNRSLIILRNFLVEKYGGLDEVVRQIKAGTFRLGKNPGAQQ